MPTPNPALKIIYVAGATTAFIINKKIYYIKITHDLPELYNSELKYIVTPNVDYWLQAQTQRLYDYRSLKYMSMAFVDGQKSLGQAVNPSSIINSTYSKTKEHIFRSKHTRCFAEQYKIELLRIDQASKLIHNVGRKFDKLQETMEAATLHLYLCRLYWFCQHHLPDHTAVVEQLIRRIGMDPKPIHPENTHIDNEILSQIELAVLEDIHDEDSMEKQQIIKNAIKINSSVLYRR